MASSVPPHPPAPPDACAGRPARVLIVDVHPVVRSGVAAVLASAGGFEMAGDTADWWDALELAHALAPDIVLLDLPVSMDHDAGSSLVALLRALPCAPSVVLFSALADQHGLQAARAAGATGFVLKDATPAELVIALRRAMEDRPTTVEALAGDDVDEAELVRLAASGNPSAWEQLYRRAYPKLLAFARRRLPRERAADAVAEAFLRALAQLDRVDRNPGGFEPWLFGIARHVIADTHRAMTGRLRVVRTDGPVPPASPLEPVIDVDEANAAGNAFARLSPGDQELLELRVIAGFSADEVATVLGKQRGSVRMAQSRAVARLRTGLHEEIGSDAS